MSYFLCPACKKWAEAKVTDCRKAKGANGWRRRRKCLGCGSRYSTLEVIIQERKRSNSCDEELIIDYKPTNKPARKRRAVSGR